MKKSFLSTGPHHTQKIGRDLMKMILSHSKVQLNNQPAIIIGLKGDLGSGKTIFIQGLAKALKIKKTVSSPTFVIMKKYKIPNQQSNGLQLKSIASNQYNYFYHFDCYRIEKAEEILNLGWKKLLSSSNIIAIEWVEKIKNILPKDITLVKFSNNLKYMKISKNLRKINIDLSKQYCPLKKNIKTK